MNPAVYDPTLAYDCHDRCLCCGQDRGSHQEGCPIALVERLEFRVEASRDRWGENVRAHASGLDLEEVAKELQDDNRMFFELGFSRNPAVHIPFVRVSVSVDVPLEDAFRSMVDSIREEENRQVETARRANLVEKRRKALLELHRQSDSFTPLGLERAREKILKDPQYKDLPEEDV